MKNFISKVGCKVATLAVGVLGAAVAVAEETSGGNTTSVAETIISDAQTTMEGILSSAGGAVSALVVAGLVIWAGIAIVGLLKRGFSAGKGR